MYILIKEFSEKYNKLYTQSKNDNRIDNDEFKALVKVYEEYRKNKKNKLSIFLNLKLLVFSYNNVFIINKISINIFEQM